MREVLNRTVSMKAFIAMALLLIALSSSLAYAVTMTWTTVPKVATIGGAIITVTGDLTVSVGDLAVAPADVGANTGASGDGIEIIPTPYATANNAITKNDWVIAITIAESDVNKVLAGKKFKVEVTGLAGLPTIYIQQATIDASNIEGIVCTYDLGASITDLTLMIRVTEYP